MIIIIDENLLRQIKESNDIVSVISQYVTLKRNGEYYIGECPFHKDKTPSLRVYPKTQSFFCFGCGAGSESETNGSDVFAFISSIENISFPQAVEMLANKANILLKKDKGGEIFKYYEKNLELSRGFYTKLYEHPEILEMLYSRGLDDADIQKWRIGYSDDGYFKDRIIFPIITHQRTTFFTGRTIGDDVKKYLNSKSNGMFSKVSTMYGIDYAIQEINETKKVYIVEGPLDCISMHKMGLANTIGTLGCEISDEQVERIVKLGVLPVFVYDGDDAGIKAMTKGCHKFLDVGISPSIVILPNKMDPNDMLLNHESPAQFIKDNDIDFCIFKIRWMLDNYNTKLFQLNKEFVLGVNSFIESLSTDDLKEAMQMYVKTITTGGFLK